MPVYDYDCATCGAFSDFRPMADYDKPAPCATCGAPAPRAIFTAPALATMAPGARAGMAVNERSRHEPRRSSGAHAAGCGCCGPSSRMKKAAAGPGAGAARSFPAARPWMLSH